MRPQEPQRYEFDIFTNHKTGSWGFLTSIEADDEKSAKSLAMREHGIYHANQIAVYPKK
jgi:hypothetical protein